jgi:hypothetical protein
MAKRLSPNDKRAIRQRTTIYMRYRITKEMLRQIAAEIPINLQEERLNAYRHLRYNWFTPMEAYNIVTAKTPKTKELQKLDLTHPDWQDRIKVHRLAMIEQVKDIINVTGFTPSNARKVVIRNIDDYYRVQDKDKSFDVFDDYIKNKKLRPPEYDFKEAVENQIKKYSQRIWLSDKHGRPIRLSDIQA